MRRILEAEIIKAFTRPRSYIGMGSIIALVALIDASFYFTGKEYIDLLFQNFDQVFSLKARLLMETSSVSSFCKRSSFNCHYWLRW